MKIESAEELAQRFSEARIAKGLSMRETARLAKCSNATISQLEAKQITNIKVNTLLQIAKVLDLQMDL